MSYYNIKFDDQTSFPKVLKAVKVDRDLHVQIQFTGNPLTLTGFTQGVDAKLKSRLKTFPPYIKNLVDGNPYSLLDEI